MKPLYFFIPLFLTALISGQTAAQVRLPLDANNCAIFNAINPDSSLECAQTDNLGTARGLIVRINGDASKVPVSSPNQVTELARPKRSKISRIDYKAAKSESGYYIHFAFDSEALEKEYQEHLKRLAIVLNAPSMKENCVKITGHTDTTGDAQYNLKLSSRRAQSVYEYLTKLDKIDKSRFSISGLGETLPLPDKAGTSPFNRRVEFSSKSVPEGCQS